MGDELKSSSGVYNHQNEVNKLEEINKTLKDLQEDIAKKTVKAHILHVDLTTQFDPKMLMTVKKTLQSCEDCKAKTEEQFNQLNSMDKEN